MENQIEVSSEKIEANELADLGFTQASKDLGAKKALAKKLAIAYENYRFVTPKNFDEFNKALKAKTMHKSKNGYPEYDQLKFTNISNYSAVPPKMVLNDLRKAKDLNCFDSFEIAQIQSVEERPDPILFGTIIGCQNKFYISQWDNDVRIEDLLKDNEG